MVRTSGGVEVTAPADRLKLHAGLLADVQNPGELFGERNIVLVHSLAVGFLFWHIVGANQAVEVLRFQSREHAWPMRTGPNEFIFFGGGGGRQAQSR
eukprot:COSAG06_NODE_7411_length_2514_cov_1.614907_3_plen_97_part_00